MMKGTNTVIMCWAEVERAIREHLERNVLRDENKIETISVTYRDNRGCPGLEVEFTCPEKESPNAADT